MYSPEKIVDALRHPRRGFRELNRLYYTRLRTKQFNTQAPNVFDQNWDNLIILDACRFDTFEESHKKHDLPGDLSARQSRGASTNEFLQANFDGRNLHDTVYVTGTTMLYRNGVLNDNIELSLHQIIDVWEDAIDIGEWGITPERMKKRAKKAAENYPNKRLIIHFIQPHIPFIGEFGRERFGDIEGSIWRKKRRGEIDVSDGELWRAYRENLHCVLPSVKTLLQTLKGRTAVSADHGQLIGDRGFPFPIKDYGHPSGIYSDPLVKVPWFVHNNGPRKRIVAEPPESGYGRKDRSRLDQKAHEHLRHLGYMN